MMNITSDCHSSVQLISEQLTRLGKEREPEEDEETETLLTSPPPQPPQPQSALVQINHPDFHHQINLTTSTSVSFDKPQAELQLSSHSSTAIPNHTPPLSTDSSSTQDPTPPPLKPSSQPTLEESNSAKQSSSDAFPNNPSTQSGSLPSHQPVEDSNKPVEGPAPSAPTTSSATTTKPPSVSTPSKSQPSSSQPKAMTTTTATTTTRSRRQLGEYTLGKTLGAGSMGKVKLAVSSVTGEKIAIKIIPRHTSMQAAQQQLDKELDREYTSKEKEKDAPGSDFLIKARTKDLSKEVRTIREASIVLLLHHPYVCGMKSMLVYPHHYYMLFEYVNGGQMLDYIISHGRLRERAARKFARQMGSALQYSHANSIVHRDLKIENILISKTGNIKIIDFGLSNLFSPNSNLQTFCGSLYFAAPEVLNAKVYIGPEVDVWSFGIVLFVLVCGKVPFDDQSMPALHAKIKRGQVDYPTWLSSECKHLLSRMLVTNPQHRASLTEVLSHPWIVKGFDGPPDPHIPHREPLRLSEIDPEVIKGMTGFEFGTTEKIEADLRAVLSSELYNKVVKLYDQRRGVRTDLTSPGGSASSVVVKKEHKGDRELPKASGPKTPKRFSGFGFYGKKVAGGLAAVLGGGGANSKSDEKGTDGGQLTGAEQQLLLNGQTIESLDPTRGFHPLISIYYLVREKIEREKIYGPGFFASSTLSVTGPPLPPAPPSAYTSAYSPSMPDFPAVRPSPSTSTTTQAEANTVTEPRRTAKTRTNTLPPPLDPISPRTPTTPTHKSQARPSTAVAILTTTTTTPTTTPMTLSPTQVKTRKRRSIQAITPSSRTDFECRPNERAELGHGGGRAERVVSMIEDGSVERGSPGTSSFARRFGSFLGRSSSGASEYKRGHRPRTSLGGAGHKAGTRTAASALPQVEENRTQARVEDDGEMPLSAPPAGSLGRATTLGGSGRSRTMNAHQRVSSISGNETQMPHSASAGTSWRPRLTSLQGPGAPPAMMTSEEDEEEGEEEEEPGEDEVGEVEQEVGQSRSPGQVGFSARAGSPSRSHDKIKPIYLKGLFSVATTSTRGPVVLREDLLKVLERIGFEYREIKGGFECAHAPSIDLESLGRAGLVEDSVEQTGTIRKRGSKGSIGERSNVTPPGTVGRKKHDLVVRFEIFIVKMPLLPGISGLQFRRISGNVWQYQTFARRILQELKL